MFKSELVRPLSFDDLPLVMRLLSTSEYIYQRFMLNELPALLRHTPGVGIFSGNALRGFLLAQTVNPPTAWIGGFGVSWTESRSYLKLLDTLLDQLTPLLLRRGVRYLHYSGNDTQNDWLREALLRRGFMPYRLLYAYDKLDFEVPTRGNQDVIVRLVTSSDIPNLLKIEEACFENLWRYDASSFAEIIATHPYFVVAELQGKVVGYQFNALDSEYGYLVRIAVHPSVNSKGIGARLMYEAVEFFRRANVLRIMLNTEDTNYHAHRLYEWFGFIRIPQMGFVLRKQL